MADQTAVQRAALRGILLAESMGGMMAAQWDVLMVDSLAMSLADWSVASLAEKLADWMADGRAGPRDTLQAGLMAEKLVA